MTAQPGLFVARDGGGNGTTPTGARLALAGLLTRNADGTVRVGVLADGLGAAVTGAAGMTYNIRKHVAVTKATEANGPVLVPNDGTVSVPTDPAPGSNSRIDVVYVLQQLVTGDGGAGSTNAPVFGVAKGSASASPSAPSIPSGALELARVTVPSGTSATSGLTFTPGPWTAVQGSSVPVRSQAERDALSVAEGSRVYRLDKHRTETYLGASIGWDHVDWTTIVPGGAGWSTVAEGSAWARAGNVGFLRVGASKATFSADEGILSVPTPLIPAAVTRLAGSFNAASRYARLDTDGILKTDGASTGGIVGVISFPIA